MAGTLTATIPAIVVFLVFQRALVRGISTTGLKD
jgi:multiple sugar transport system permease protein